MRTAIVSDLHLGSASGEDLARDPTMRRILLEEIAGADRLVLLGDALELRELELAPVLEIVRPFFEELGEAMAGRRVVLVPGNHDHRLAEPLLEEVALAGGPLGLEHRALPTGEAGARIAAWLGEAELSIAYPGVWLREDVYATHGHYMDCHMSLPRIECIAAAAIMRASGRPPDPAAPSDYERVLRPIYGFSFGLAEAGLARSATRPSERAWRSISGRRRNGSRARRAALRACRAAFGGATGRCGPSSSRTSRRRRARAAASRQRPRRSAGCESTRLTRSPATPTAPARKKARRSGCLPMGASCTTQGAGSTPTPFITRAPHPAPTGPAPSPGSRTRARRAGSACWATVRARSCERSSGGLPERRRPLQPLGDDAPDLQPGVLLQEVAGVLDRPRRRVVELRRDPLADREGEHRVRIGPEHQRRSIVLAQGVGHPLALGG